MGRGKDLESRIAQLQGKFNGLKTVCFFAGFRQEMMLDNILNDGFYPLQTSK